MADDLDFASEYEALNTQDAIDRTRYLAAMTPRLKPRGECLNPRCGEPFEDRLRLFCGPKCEGEHSRLSAREKLLLAEESEELDAPAEHRHTVTIGGLGGHSQSISTGPVGEHRHTASPYAEEELQHYMDSQ